MPPHASITVDAGAHFLAVMPLVRVANPHQLLISNGLATMGFAVPAAIGVSLARPGDPVVAFTGDGGLSMVLGELETIARLELPITIVVFNDAALSLIEIKQVHGHGGPEAVRYRPVDFAAIAYASGLDGIVVESEGELTAALSGSWDRPRLIDARIDPSAYPALIAATRG
jgi:acetolactate synthase-1/2/3 large subunit